MRKKIIVIFAAAAFGLSVLWQAASIAAAAPINSETANSQAALTGKSAFAGRGRHGSRGFSTGERGRISREFEDGQGFADRGDIHRHRFAGHRSFGRGKYGDEWGYNAGHHGGGYEAYEGQYYYGPGPYSYGPAAYYGSSYYYGPSY